MREVTGKSRFDRYGYMTLCLAILLFSVPTQVSLGEDFSDSEIRVIRPRFMTKQGRFELGGQFNAVMNQTFIYTFLGSGILTYHFTETLGLELAGSYGFSIDKEDKRILQSEFDIQTQILRTQDYFEGSILFTPIYGKYQVASGRLVYFDTYLAAGGGMTGIHYNYEHCIDPSKIPESARDNTAVVPIPAPKTVHYPTISFGLGQRFFLTRKLSLKWDVRTHAVLYDSLDGSCNPDLEENESKTHFNITMQLGASRFF